MTDRPQNAFRQRRSRARDRVRRSWNPGPGEARDLAPPDDNAVVHCGWGRLLFGHTFDSPEALTEAIRQEAPDERDIAIYLSDPHVLLAQAPEALFLDPSHTYRLDYQRYRPRRDRVPGVYVRRVRSTEDAAAVNRIYAKHGMVQVDREFFMLHRGSRNIVHLLAIDESSGDVVGTVTGIDHVLPSPTLSSARACGAWRSTRRPACRASERCWSAIWSRPSRPAAWRRSTCR